MVLAVVVVAMAGTAWANVDEDLVFASGLINFEPSFKDFAKRVIDNILLKDPGQRNRTRVVEAEIMIKDRKFAEAETLAKEIGLTTPQGQAISLALGQNYFVIGELEKARELYEGFFKQYEGKAPTDKDVVTRYRDAAYQFAQMQEMVNDYEGAARSYGLAEQVVDPSLKRSVLLARTKALVRAAEQKSGDEKNKMLDEVLKLCEALQWGGMDMQFVDSIVIMANVELAKGNPDGARKVLMSNMDMIKPIDQELERLGLRMKDSPMAGARSLLGRLWKEEAERMAKQPGKDGAAIEAYSKALGEFYNVFVKYGDSSWGSAAGIESKEIKEILESKYGKTVKIDLSKVSQNKLAGTEFMMADNLYRQKRYEEAAKEYLVVLEHFPEAGELAIGALANLARCYMYENDDLMAKVVAHYVGERFGGKSPISAQAIVSLGKLYEDGGNPDMGLYMYNQYLKYCPGDAFAGQILFYLASKAEQVGKQEEADKFYAKIITDYPQDQNYPKALSRRAWRSYEDKDYEGAIEGMKLYIEESRGQPSPTLAQAMFALGHSYQKTENLTEAVKQFNALVSAIAPEGNPYSRSAEDLTRNQRLLEQARFSLAFTLSRLPSDRTRQAAVLKLDEFLKFHEKSLLAPGALNLKGALQLALKDPGANETYAKLARDYPDTDEGRNAQYARISGALELGQVDQAREAFQAMMSSPGSYSADEFVRVGQAMLARELWTEAGQAFDQTIKKSDVDSLLERAYYGVGVSRFELGDPGGATEALDELMKRWPRSALFYPAKFTLAQANLKLNNYSAAKIALNDIFKFARDAEVINDATLLYAEVLKSEGDMHGALGSYKRLEYFGGTKTEKSRKQVATAILAAIEVATEMNRHAEVIESTDRYLELFPTSSQVQEIRQARSRATVALATEVAASGGEGGAEE